MAKYVPLISSGVAGPLGVLHLPRLWQKLSLEATNQLADGYPGIGQGYDTMVINALGLDPVTVREFVNKTLPTYPQFEAWVKQQPDARIDKATIDKSNRAITGYNHDDQTRQNILAAVGISEESAIGHGAVDLNNVEDWQEFHREVINQGRHRDNSTSPAAGKDPGTPAAAETTALPPPATPATEKPVAATSGAPDSD